MANNNWKSFIVKALVFIIVAVGVDFLIGKTYRILENKALGHSPYGMVTEYTMWKVDADVIIMGASEAQHSYIPSYLEEQLGMTVYNCGKDGSRFYYQNAMINGILDRYSPKMIIWSLSPNELCAPSLDDKGRLSQLNPFYYNNNFCREILKTKSKYEPIKLISSSYSYNSRLFPLMYKIIMPDYQYEYGGYSPLYGTQDGLEIISRNWGGTYDEKVNEVFECTIERCFQNDVQLVIVFTPRLERESHTELTTYRQLKKTIEKYGVPIIEELYHDKELMSINYFKDNAHLNDEGAKFFNQKLSRILRDLKRR